MTGLWVWPWQQLQTSAFWPSFSLVLGGSRFPRPLLTDSYAAIVIALALCQLQPLLIQGDVHGGVAVALLSGVVVCLRLVRARFERGALGEVAWLLAAALLTLSPFIAQQLLTSPDVVRRMGTFPVARSHLPAQWSEWAPRALQASSLVVGISLLAGAAEPRRRRSAAYCGLGLCLTVLAGYAAMPAFALIAGRLVQPYHFEDRFLRFTSWVVVAMTALLFATAARGPTRFLLRRSRHPAALAMFAEAALAMTLGVLFWRELLRRDHTVVLDGPRQDLALGSQYRDDLVDVTRELARPRYASRRILGTLDHGLSLWWTAFQHRYVLVSDPFPSTRPDSEQEDRLLHLLRLLGVSRTSFESLIQDRTLQVMWLSSAKYAISPLHSFAPISDYSAAQAELIHGGSILSSWQVTVPKSEVVRLTERFASQHSRVFPWQKADILVLGPWERRWGLVPDPSEFREIFSNSSFRIWEPR